MNFSFRPPISSGVKSGDDDSEADAERSPIETQIAFEVVDENEAFWKLFPTKTGVCSNPSATPSQPLHPLTLE